MNTNLVTAVFDGRSEAESAAADLRAAGVPDSALSVIARQDGVDGDFGDAPTHDVDGKGEGLLKGAIAGGGIGALLGIAALAIPGVGPLVAAGAIASSAIPSAAAIGAGAGAVAGGVFLSVDADEAGLGADQLRDILSRNGGRSSATATTDATATTY